MTSGGMFQEMEQLAPISGEAPNASSVAHIKLVSAHTLVHVLQPYLPLFTHGCPLSDRILYRTHKRQDESLEWRPVTKHRPSKP